MMSTDRPLGAGRSLIHVVVASRDELYVADLLDYLNSNPVGIAVDGVVPDLAGVPSAIRKSGCVVLIDGDVAGELGKVVDTAMSAGAARVFLLVADPSKSVDLPDRVEPLFKYSMGSTLVERIRSVPAPADLPPLPSRTSPGAIERTVIALYSPRGGAGCSTLAANLAYLYAAKGKRVALVDFARYGAQHVILRQPQRGQGLSSLVTLLSQQPESGGSERVSTYLQQALHRIQFGSVQFQLLPAAQPARMDLIGQDHARIILEHFVRAGFEIVIVDVSQELSDRVRGVLASATHVAIPVLPEIVSVWHALQIRDLLISGLGVRPMFVINRMTRRSGFDSAEFARLGGKPLLGIVTDDSRSVEADLSLGRLTAMRRHSPFTRSARRLAQALCPVFDTSELSGGKWPWSRR